MGYADLVDNMGTVMLAGKQTVFNDTSYLQLTDNEERQDDDQQRRGQASKASGPALVNLVVYLLCSQRTQGDALLRLSLPHDEASN